MLLQCGTLTHCCIQSPRLLVLEFEVTWPLRYFPVTDLTGSLHVRDLLVSTNMTRNHRTPTIANFTKVPEKRHTKKNRFIALKRRLESEIMSTAKSDKIVLLFILFQQLTVIHRSGVAFICTHSSIYHTETEKKRLLFISVQKINLKVKMLTRDFLSSASQKWTVLGNHFRNFQSARAKCVIYLCGINWTLILPGSY